MKLYTLKRYMLAAAFFLLGQDLRTVLQITCKDLKDPILGILVCRMMLL